MPSSPTGRRRSVRVQRRRESLTQRLTSRHCRTMDRPQPSISIIIPCFNAAGFLPRAIDSVVAQGIAAVEIIVVDDASLDDSIAVVEGLARRHPGIVIIPQKVNAGPAAARNAGLAAAT